MSSASGVSDHDLSILMKVGEPRYGLYALYRWREIRPREISRFGEFGSRWKHRGSGLVSPRSKILQSLWTYSVGLVICRIRLPRP